MQDRKCISKKVNKKIDSFIEEHVKNTYKNENLLIHITQKYLKHYVLFFVK